MTMSVTKDSRQHPRGWTFDSPVHRCKHCGGEVRGDGDREPQRERRSFTYALYSDDYYLRQPYTGRIRPLSSIRVRPFEWIRPSPSNGSPLAPIRATESLW